MMAEYCPKCRRILGIGCACNLSFKDKIKTLHVDKNSLTDDDQQWRDYDRITGQDEKRKAWGRSKLNG
jgi:hypothetical protein